MKIAMISYYLPSESKIGVGHQVHALANELVTRGHSVTVFSPCRTPEGARYNVQNVSVGKRLRTFRFAANLRKQDLSGFDALHAHGDDYWLWRRRVPVHVRTVHGSCFEEAKHIRGVVERTRMVLLGCSEALAAAVADHTVAVSPPTLRWLPGVNRVIPNGVSSEVFKPGVSRSAHPTILFVGTWGGRKRGGALATAFANDVRPHLPTAELRMVCQDAPEQLPAGVVTLGRLDERELVAEYQAAWVFCLPSDYEGFGIPYAEAMACGTPVVTTPNPGALFVVEDGRSGQVVPLESLGATLLALLKDPQRRDVLARRGLQRVQKFTLQDVAEHYEDLYQTPPDRGLRARSRALGSWVASHSSRQGR
ncbi:glycosyltransferase family 4 protein [Ornithinimicrobium cerasi]|uniref:glycosyltransferase family 4 protein n=1 Tax=Ornithinimicrobium cerasi TaxID=2248773 RepID=UPI000F003160|nr:glycosyltransferase family 4 protein [Ornithinimicrobium cerasi]